MTTPDITPATDEQLQRIAESCGNRVGQYTRFTLNGAPMFFMGPHEEGIISMLARIQQDAARAKALEIMLNECESALQKVLLASDQTVEAVGAARAAFYQSTKGRP